MKDRFYLACERDNVGSNMAFHGESGSGYPTDVRKAKTYTRLEAQATWDSGRSYDLPVSADHVDSQLVWKIDMQYIGNDVGTGLILPILKGDMTATIFSF